MPLTHASIIPLIGGLAIGVAQALDSDPEYFASYAEHFARNERHLQHYYTEIPFYDLSVPFWQGVFQSEPQMKGIDVVSTVCPCAGLSITSSRSNNHGAESTHNEWMYRTAEFALSTIKPKVFFGENAPALFGEKGLPVAVKLAKIGQKHGYSFSMVKTNTMLHGIPQDRPRAFYFLWRSKSGKAPRFLPLDQRTPTLSDFLRQVQYPEDGVIDRLEYCDVPLPEDIFYQYAVSVYGDAWRAEIDGYTVIDHFKKIGRIRDLFNWAAGFKDHPQASKVDKQHTNIKNNRGMWDASPKIVSLKSPAVMFKNVERIVHPFEDRFLNVRELMALMGFPTDFSLWIDPDKPEDSAIDEAMHHISQNVPVATAKAMAGYVRDVLEGRMPQSSSRFYMFDNTKGKRVIVPGMEEV